MVGWWLVVNFSLLMAVGGWSTIGGGWFWGSMVSDWFLLVVCRLVGWMMVVVGRWSILVDCCLLGVN